jgi:hypothetical protein
MRFYNRPPNPEASTGPRTILAPPAGYLVPLRDEGEPAHSFVFAFTRWLRDEEVADYLPAASNFTGPGIPYRESEVVRFPLNGDGIKQLPASVFARELISSVNWSDATCPDTLIEFNELRRKNGYFIQLSDFVVILREGEQPKNELGLPGFPAGKGALWREGRATLWVDLDEMFRSNALRALHAIVSDLSTAAGAIGLERLILEGRASKWDSDLGRLLTPEETLERYEQERLKMLDWLGNTLFRRAIPRPRLPWVEPAVRERAKEARNSLKEEWDAGRRCNLTLALLMKLAEQVTQFAGYIGQAPPRPLTQWGSEFDAFRAALLQKLRARLNASMTEDYLGHPDWRAKLQKREVSIEEVPIDKKLAVAESETPEAEPCSIDEILASAFGRELVMRAHFTPTEKQVLAALAQMDWDDSLAAWARRNDMAPATANVHKFNAKQKLEKAKKLT